MLQVRRPAYALSAPFVCLRGGRPPQFVLVSVSVGHPLRAGATSATNVSSPSCLQIPSVAVCAQLAGTHQSIWWFRMWLQQSRRLAPSALPRRCPTLWALGRLEEVPGPSGQFQLGVASGCSSAGVRAGRMARRACYLRDRGGHILCTPDGGEVGTDYEGVLRSGGAGSIPDPLFSVQPPRLPGEKASASTSLSASGPTTTTSLRGWRHRLRMNVAVQLVRLGCFVCLGLSCQGAPGCQHGFPRGLSKSCPATASGCLRSRWRTRHWRRHCHLPHRPPGFRGTSDARWSQWPAGDGREGLFTSRCRMGVQSATDASARRTCNHSLDSGAMQSTSMVMLPGQFLRPSSG